MFHIAYHLALRESHVRLGGPLWIDTLLLMGVTHIAIDLRSVCCFDAGYTRDDSVCGRC
jgi:hypothetical protein